MSKHDPTREAREAESEQARTAVVSFDDGGCLVYDRQNPQAWLQAGEDSVLEVRE